MKICFLVLLAVAGGCSSVGELSREERELAVKVERYGRVAPELLDKNLTAGQKDKMFMEMSAIKWEQLSEKIALRTPTELRSDSVISRENALAAQKAYLRGRRLLKKSFSSGARLAYHRQAIEQLSAGLEHDPNNAYLHTVLAEAYFGIGKESAGIKHCWQALDSGGADFEAWQILGGGFMKQGLQEEAAVCFHKALGCSQYSEDNPQSAVLHMQMATSLNSLGYLLAAAGEYQKSWDILLQQRHYGHTDITVSQLISNIHVTLLIEAQLYLRMGYIYEAVELLWRGQESLSLRGSLVKPFVLSLTLQPLSLQVRYNQVAALCRYLIAIGYDSEGTLEVFYQSCVKMSKYDAYLDELALWHKSADLWSLLPLPIEGHKWLEGGEELLNYRLYAYGLALADKNAQAEKVLNAHFAMVDFSSADEDEYLAYRDMGRLYGKTGHLGEMLWVYSVYLEKGNGDVSLTLAEIKKTLSGAKGWSEQFDKWRSDGRIVSNSTGCFLLGQLAVLQKDDIAAEELYREALRIRPDFAMVQKELIELLLKQGRNEDVLACISQAGLDDDIEMLYYAGQACKDLGRLDEAARHYKKLIDLNADSPKVYMALAEVLYYQDEYNLAEELLLEVQSRWPGEGDVYGHLLALYGRWSEQANITDAFRAVAQARTRKMLVSWIGSSRQGSDLSGSSEAMGRITAALKKMSDQYPESQVVGLLLCELYVANEQYDKAIAETGRLCVDFPDDKDVLTVSAEVNEKYGDPSLAASQRLKLWQSNKGDMKLLAAALRSMREAGKATEALEILRGNDLELVVTDLAAVDLLRVEAMRLFMVTRQYNSAVEILEAWYGLTLASIEGQDDNEVSQLVCQKLLSNFVWSLTEAGDYERAVLQAKTLYKQYCPDDLQMALWLGRTLNIRLLFDLSLDLLGDLLAERGDDLALRLQWYRTMVKAGKAVEAEAEAKLWVEKQSGTKKYLDASLMLGVELRDCSSTIEFLRNEISAKPDNNTLKLQLADVLIESKEYDEADGVLAGMSVDEDIFPNWLDLRIALDISRGQWQRAIDRVAGLAGNKSSVYIQKLKVRILDLGDQAEKALEIQRKIASDSPGDLGVGLQYSFLLERTGRVDEAIGVLKQLLEEHPDDGGIKNNLGYLLVGAGQEIDWAGQLLKEGLAANPESGPTLDSLGWFYYKEGRFELALEYLLQAAAIMHEPDPEVLGHLGDTAYRLGRKEQAGVYWQWALDELDRRLNSQWSLLGDKERIEKKLERLESGEDAGVADVNSRL